MKKFNFWLNVSIIVFGAIDLVLIALDKISHDWLRVISCYCFIDMIVTCISDFIKERKQLKAQEEKEEVDNDTNCFR